MKKVLIGIVALLACTTFTSCEQDAPAINFSHSTTITSDFSGIIKAINDMSLSLSEKLSIINSAIQDHTLTLTQKMDILNEAVNKGILSHEQMAQKTIDAINAMSTSLTDKLAAVEAALTNVHTTLDTKLALIEATMKTELGKITDSNTLIKEAIEALDGTMEEKLAAIETAIKDTNLTLETKLGAIDASVTAGFASTADAMKLTREALVASLDKGFGDTAASLAAVNTALGRLSIKDGVYAADKDGMHISPSAWAALKADPEMYEAFMNTLEVIKPAVTTSQVSSHSCVIGITLKSYEEVELLSKQEVYDDNGVNKPAYNIVRMFSKAIYTINKGGCALGCWEINVTDVAGTNEKYNFNGGAGGDVELVFWDGAENFVLAGHVEVIMR